MSGYGKHFESMYTGSMVGMGTDVFAVWGYVIAHVRDGVIELNPRLLAGIFGSTREAMAKAVELLCEPDPESRNPDAEGRRLIHEHAHAYRVVSAEKYKELRDEEARREQNREAQRRHRLSATVSNGQQSQPPSAPSESDSSSDSKSESGDSSPHSPPLVPESVTLPRAKRSADRGTRLPEDWVPNTERADLKTLIAKFVVAGGDYPTAVIEFRNYWTSRPKNATKLDWEKTLANRLIELTDECNFRRRAPPVVASDRSSQSTLAFQKQLERVRQLEAEEKAKAS